jgi:alpha-N-arabinofuranosidase
MILIDKEKCVLTPTYYVFKMYVPFQDDTSIPVTFDAGTYTHGGVTLPRVDAVAAKGADGKLLLEITNLDAENPAVIDAGLAGITVKSAKAETMTAVAVDSINTFESPNAVAPKSTTVKVQNGSLSLAVEPRSITVVLPFFSKNLCFTADCRQALARGHSCLTKTCPNRVKRHVPIA